MSEDRLRDALRTAGGDTAEVVIGRDVLGTAADVFAAAFGDRAAVVVADEITFAVAGRAVHDALLSTGRQPEEPFVFPGSPVLYADYGNVRTLARRLGETDAIPVAVGAGTINDIAKRAASERERQYLSVATAASVDGYAAFGAAVTKDGFKQTMSCPAPRAVLADLEILGSAPPEMTAAGYADLQAKVTSGADWIVADALEVEAIDPTAWSLVQDRLREATARPAELAAGDPGALGELTEGLIMAGLAMQVAGSSRPASGAEHQFSHLWEMEGLGQHPDDGRAPLSHGYKVGLGTIAIAALYERMLARDLTDLDIAGILSSWPNWGEVERRIRAAHDAGGLGDAAVEQSRPKYVDRDALAQRLRLLVERWPELRERLRRQLLPAADLRARLRSLGCPTTPEEIGLTPGALRATYRRAQMIRPRYTVLDLAIETGLLDVCVDELFAPGGFWTTAV